MDNVGDEIVCEAHCWEVQVCISNASEIYNSCDGIRVKLSVSKKHEVSNLGTVIANLQTLLYLKTELAMLSTWRKNIRWSNLHGSVAKLQKKLRKRSCQIIVAEFTAQHVQPIIYSVRDKKLQVISCDTC